MAAAPARHPTTQHLGVRGISGGDPIKKTGDLSKSISVVPKPSRFCESGGQALGAYTEEHRVDFVQEKKEIGSSQRTRSRAGTAALLWGHIGLELYVHKSVPEVRMTFARCPPACVPRSVLIFNCYAYKRRFCMICHVHRRNCTIRFSESQLCDFCSPRLRSMTQLRFSADRCSTLATTPMLIHLSAIN